jgi:hypothetical protein
VSFFYFSLRSSLHILSEPYLQHLAKSYNEALNPSGYTHMHYNSLPPPLNMNLHIPFRCINGKDDR